MFSSKHKSLAQDKSNLLFKDFLLQQETLKLFTKMVQIYIKTIKPKLRVS
jgi:hypothetical protein